MADKVKQKNASNVNINICKFLTFALRHKPHVAGLVLDEHGFADINKVLSSLERMKNIKINEQELSSAIHRCASKILQIENGKIRARFGHSVILNMNVPDNFIESSIIPHTLFALIDGREMWSIMSSGLKSSNLKSYLVIDNSRLKQNENTKIVKIDSEKAGKKSGLYYNKENDSYFCKFIPASFISFTI